MHPRLNVSQAITLLKQEPVLPTRSGREGSCPDAGHDKLRMASNPNVAIMRVESAWFTCVEASVIPGAPDPLLFLSLAFHGCRSRVSHGSALSQRWSLWR